MAKSDKPADLTTFGGTFTNSSPSVDYSMESLLVTRERIREMQRRHEEDQRRLWAEIGSSPLVDWTIHNTSLLRGAYPIWRNLQNMRDAMLHREGGQREFVMTEAQWLASTDPALMLRLLERAAVVTAPDLPDYVVSDRQLRLFATAIWRDGIPLFETPYGAAAVLVAETAEAMADGLPLPANAPQRGDVGHRHYSPLLANAHEAARNMASENGERDNSLIVAHLLRCIIGNPWRRLPDGRPWLRWNGGTILGLATAIYDERRYGDLPVLADALEDAGCDSQAILAHCRGAGPHVRGCFVLDLLLNKNPASDRPVKTNASPAEYQRVRFFGGPWHGQTHAIPLPLRPVWNVADHVEQEAFRWPSGDETPLMVSIVDYELRPRSGEWVYETRDYLWSPSVDHITGELVDR